MEFKFTSFLIVFLKLIRTKARKVPGNPVPPIGCILGECGGGSGGRNFFPERD